MLGARAYSAEQRPMSGPPGAERLSDSRYVVVVLRLLVDAHSDVVHGEVGGQPDEMGSEGWIHFHGSDGLLEALQAWLHRDTHEEGKGRNR
jgi:hypothetical protein